MITNHWYWFEKEYKFLVLHMPGYPCNWFMNSKYPSKIAVINLKIIKTKKIL